MQKTLADLEDKGYLRLVPDPEDRRAKHVRLSRTGKQRQNNARDYLRILEAELRARVGSDSIKKLVETLEADWGEPPAVKAE